MGISIKPISAWPNTIHLVRPGLDVEHSYYTAPIHYRSPHPLREDEIKFLIDTYYDCGNVSRVDISRDYIVVSLNTIPEPSSRFHVRKMM